MRILITGAAGMIGRKLTERLPRTAARRHDRSPPSMLHDVVARALRTPGIKVASDAGDLSDARRSRKADRRAAGRRSSISPAIVSGEAEADFEKGYRVNLDGTAPLFEAIRKIGDGYRPRVVFTSSIAVFGAPFPEAIGDEFLNAPLTSYGTQKAIGELLLSDYTPARLLRRHRHPPADHLRAARQAEQGGLGLLLRHHPRAAAGQEAMLPVPRNRAPLARPPRAAVGFLMHAAELERRRSAPRRNLTMPGVSVTVGEQIEALRTIAGEKAVKLIREEPDATIWAIVKGWPATFDAQRRASSASAPTRASTRSSAIHIEDELGGKIAV